MCVGIKQKNTWANQSQSADCCCIVAKKVQPVLQTFCLLTTTKLASPSSALAQMHPLGTAHLFLAPSATLSSEELALPLSSLLFTCASSFLGASEMTVQYCSYSRYATLQRKGNIFLWLEATLLLIHCPPCCRPQSSLLLHLSLIFNTIKQHPRNTSLKAEKIKSVLSSTLTVSQLEHGLASNIASKKKIKKK